MMTNKRGAIIIEGHVQGLSNTRSLGELDIPIYALDKTNCIARYSKYCKKYFRCPDYLNDDFVDYLISLAKKEKIKDWVLIPSNDHAVLTISKNIKRLEKYFKIITPDYEIIANIYDKSKLLRIAEKAGLPIPKTWHFQSVNEEFPQNLTFPVITKGRFGLNFYKALNKKAFFANNEVELRVQLNTISEKFDIRKALVQELIPSNGENKTISFTSFCIEGIIKAFWMGVKLREHPLQFGTATFAKSVYIEDCLIQSKPLLKELKYTGVCEVEYLYDPISKKYKLIEINARTWLWVGLAKACGVDYAKIIYNHFNNEKPLYPNKYELDKYWINPVSDTLFSLSAIFKRRLGIVDYLNSISRHHVNNALFQKGDLKPGFIYILKLVSFFSKR